MALRCAKMAFSRLPMRLETAASVQSIAAPVRQASLLPRHIPPLSLPLERTAKFHEVKTFTSHRAFSSTAAEEIRQPQYDAYVWGSPEAVPTQQLAPCMPSPAITYSPVVFVSFLRLLMLQGTKVIRRESATACPSSTRPFDA